MKINYTLFRIWFLFFSFFVFLTAHSQNEDQVGQWSNPIPFGIVPVAAANLPDGRLITWSAKYRDTYTETEDGMTFTELFDPFLGTDGQALGHTTSNTDHDMFCPGINNLPDGRILAAGGTSSERTSIYDPSTGLWSVAADMNIRRGYQGNTTLSDGSVFTLGGSWSESTSINGNKDAELWSPETGWILLPGIKGEDIWVQNDLNTELRGLYRIDNHLWLWPAPDGRIFHAGPSEQMHWIDVANGGSITPAGQRGNDTYSMKGNTVMFDIGRILKTGGAQSYDSNHPAKDNAYIIDINSTTAQVNQVDNLNFERTMHNSTVLPNGQVLITGGIDHAEVFSDSGAELTAELFDPDTNTFTPVAGMATPRTYHSVAILLIDGRVFVGGGGLCDVTPGCVNHADAEIYSPPYLFTSGGALATRPTIDNAPSEADYNSNINVSGSTTISEFTLIRSSAVTHSTNNEQRRVPVTHTGGSGNYSVAIPDRNLLPPGYYMLFALDTNGVPSIARSIRIGNAVPLEDNPNLVLHLEFEETSGSTAFDSSDNENDATIFDVDDNAATKVPSTDNWTNNGLFGGAVEMDGFEFQSNTIMDVPYDSSFDSIEESITVMAWVNRNDIQYNVGILSHDYPSLFFGFHNSLYKWAFRTSSGVVDCYAGYSPSNQWVHIAATYDGDTAKLYANGVEICTDQITGPINLDPNTPDFSSFTSSGFYEFRDPATNSTLINNNYNESGVTDEINGRIDELKVYNKALGPEEIKTFYELGVGLPGVQSCPPGTITAEFKLGDGNWIAGNNINAPEGSEVYIRAQTTGEYFATTFEIDGNTFSSISDFTQTTGYQINTGTKTGDNDGLVSSDDSGQYVLTTATGCSIVMNLNVTGNCDPGDTQVSAEWSIDGGITWDNGPEGTSVSVMATAGDDVRLSLLPNNIGGDPGNPLLRFDAILPNGSRESDLTNLILDAVSVEQAGVYILESQEGCSIAIDLTVEAVICDATNIRAEWSLDGGQTYIEASDELPVTVDANTGDEVLLSMVPNEIDFTISYEGNNVYSGEFDYNLGTVSPVNSGNYIITSAQGCSTTITLNITDPVCDATNIRAEWSLDGGQTYIEASDELPVTVDANTGDEVLLSMVPNEIDFTISYEGNNVYSGEFDYNLGVVNPANSGDYVITSAQGCSTTITLNVTDPVCDATNIRAEWSLDGGQTYIEAPDEQSLIVTAYTGDNVLISMVPNEIDFIVSHDGNEVYSGEFDYVLGVVSPADSGDYIITSSQGCSTTITLNISDLLCDATNVRAEWSLDGGQNYIEAPNELPVTVDATTGDDVLLSMVPNGTNFTVSYEGNEVYSGEFDYILGEVSPADSGNYLITTERGCTTTITLNVTNPDCNASNIIAEWSLDGGLSYLSAPDEQPITVIADTGDEVLISMLPNGISFTVSYEGNEVYSGERDYVLGMVDFSNNGDYIITTEQSCSTTLTLKVNCPSGPFTPEYIIDDTNPGNGEEEISVLEGTSLQLGIVEDNVGFTITQPGGAISNGDLNLESIGMNQAGLYTFTSEEGCTEFLQVTVIEDICIPENFTVEYTINGVSETGESTITVEEGTSVSLGIMEDGVDFSITLPDATVVNGLLDLGNIILDQAGTYMLASTNGCSAEIIINVEAVVVTNPDAVLQDIIVYPNPVRDGNVTFVLDDFMGEIIFISFYDIYGKLVLRNMVPSTHEEEVLFDVGELSTGTYIVEISRQKNSERTIKKVMKIR